MADTYDTLEFVNPYNNLPRLSGEPTNGYGLLSKSRTGSKPYQKVKRIFSPELGLYYLNFLRKVGYPYRKYDLLSLGENASFISTFLISLDSYIESGVIKVPIMDIIYGTFTLGPSYATFLKRIRWKAFLNCSSGFPMELPEWWDDIPAISIDHDIGEIFNYQYLPHWHEENTDYLEGFRALQIKESTLLQFKTNLLRLLPDTLEEIPPEEVLFTLSGSSTYQGTHWKQKYKHLTFSRERGRSKRAVIQVHPEGSRDSVINSIEDFNSISLIEKQTALLLRNFEEHIVGTNPEKFNRKYKTFQDENYYFLCRDFTKEGITKPRQILRAMLEVLHDKYPGIKAYENVSFYDKYILEMESGEILYPTRGHGLGMANALTTLMQICLMSLVIENMETEVKGNITFLTENDDIIIGFTEESDVDEFWEQEGIILEDLGLVRSSKKSFIMHRGGVFIERYFDVTRPNINEKASYHIREVLQALNACNITQAKQLISSLVYTPNKYIEKYISEIVTKFGYEFFNDEYRYPTTLGGWWNRSIYGVRLDLKVFDELNYNKKVYRAFQACKLNKINPRVENGGFVHPLEKLNALVSFSEEDRRYLGIDDFVTTAKKFSRLKYRPEAYGVAWQNLYKQRQNLYKRRFDAPFDEFIIEFRKFYNELDFLPPEGYSKEIPCEEYKGELNDVFHSVSPVLNYLSKMGVPNYKGRYLDEKWSLLGRRLDDINFRETADQRKRISRFIGLRSNLIGALTDDTYILPKNENISEFWESYINPINCAKAAQLFRINCSLPVWRVQVENEIIKCRREVYGRHLTNDELIYFSFFQRKYEKVFFIYFIRAGYTLDDIKLYMELRKPEVSEYKAKKFEDELPEDEPEGPDEKEILETAGLWYSFWEWLQNRGTEQRPDPRVSRWELVEDLTSNYRVYVISSQMGHYTGSESIKNFKEWWDDDDNHEITKLFEESTFNRAVELYGLYITTKPTSESSDEGEGNFDFFAED